MRCGLADSPAWTCPDSEAESPSPACGWRPMSRAAQRLAATILLNDLTPGKTVRLAVSRDRRVFLHERCRYAPPSRGISNSRRISEM